jgi:hypothetical protein
MPSIDNYIDLDAFYSAGFKKNGAHLTRRIDTSLTQKITVDFVGRSSKRMGLILGVNVAGVEEILSDISRYLEYPIPLGYADIFQNWRDLEIFAFGEGGDRYIQPGSKDAFKDRIDRILGIVDKNWSKLSDLARYCVDDNRLAIGHHSFRVPIILYLAGMRSELEQYVQRVLETNFVPEYPKFARIIVERGAFPRQGKTGPTP